ncbi:CCR4-NOT transcription complex subunit 2-like [Neocloeon triangulifer]|uniref:CCR4-NOT transcription complex subunit 2-like n=1 Tax=Neocloeon triangulifer TaxID=2078957 RepID=UPI00286F1402|nr:CCR4-NOT transcription complex subunit 2-like [Neocloeon triangulifer]
MSHQSPQGATRRTPTATPDSSIGSSLQQLSPGFAGNLPRSLVGAQRYPRLMPGIGTFGLGGRAAFDFDGPDAGKTPSLLDMSEFPTLGNRGDAMVTPNPTPIRNPYGMFNIMKQQEASEFNISSEDFPALPGTAQRNRRASSDDKPSVGGPTNALSQSLGGSGSVDASRASRAPGAERQAAQERGIQTHPDGRVSNIPASMLKDQFGITGLLSFIRVAENQSDLVSLSLGQDLKTLGMNLNSVESVYPNFGGPFAEMPCRPQDIDYHVPSEYLINSSIRNKLPAPKLSMYKDDLLFYFFYNCPGDAIQAAAAVELYNRDWRYHMEEKVWLTRAPGAPLLEKTATYERSTYYIFDPQRWGKFGKEFLLEYAKLEDRQGVAPHVFMPQTVSTAPSQASAASAYVTPMEQMLQLN